MNEMKPTTISEDKTAPLRNRQKIAGLWTAAIFAGIGLSSFIFSVYIVVFIQSGEFDKADKVMMPLTGVLFILSLISYFLVRRDRHNLGAGLLFYSALSIPIALVSILQGLWVIALLFIAVLLPVVIIFVVPPRLRRLVIISIVLAVFYLAGFEIWNPAYRETTELVQGFSYPMITLAFLGLLAVLIQSDVLVLSDSEMSAEERRLSASRTLLFILLNFVVVVLFYAFLFWQSRTWQMFLLLADVIIFTGFAFFGRRFILSGRLERGLWLVIAGLAFMFPVGSLLVYGTGLMYAIISVVFTFISPARLFPERDSKRASLVILAASLVCVVLDLFPRGYRLPVPTTLQVFIPIIAVLVILFALVFAIRRIWVGNLQTKLIIITLLVTILPLAAVGTIVSIQTFNALRPQALNEQRLIADRVSDQVRFFIQERIDELQALTEVSGIEQLSREQQISLLTSLLSSRDAYDELVLLDGTGREDIYISRLGIVSREKLIRRTGQPEYEIPKETAEPYFSPVAFDETSGEPYMIIAIPVFDLRSGNLSNVLAAKLRFKPVWDLMGQVEVVEGGDVYMIDNNNRVIAHRNPSVVLQGSQVNLPLQDSYTEGLQGAQVAMARSRIVFGAQTFDVVAELSVEKALALANFNLLIIVMVTLAAVILAGTTAFYGSRFITGPIGELANAADAISTGRLDRRVEIHSQDEIGTLAAAFNSMTAQLQDLIGTLEQRVADRTRALETSTEVSRRLSTILEREQLVREVVEQLVAAFGYYHAHIYLFDDSKQNLVMVGGTGDAGRTMLARHHQLEKGQGLVGRAAEENQIVLVPDVSQTPTWLPNPLLPDTKSEAAVPITIGTEVIGVLDVQHNVTNGLQQEDAGLIQAIANQVAIAIQNARAYEQVQRQALRETRITAINQRIQSATSIDDVLQIAVSELGQALNAQRSSVDLSIKASSKDGRR